MDWTRMRDVGRGHISRVIRVGSAAGETVEMPNLTQDVIVDGSGGWRSPAMAVDPQDTGSPAQSGTSSISAAADVRLRLVEARLIALAGGDVALEREVRRYLAESCARFATARVRQFVPILVEREVRGRLRAGTQPSAEERTA
jgi:hypothetical protein